jgi:hypothetical protein
MFDGQLVTFFCDASGCGESFEAAGNFKDVWESAKDDGWRCFKNTDGEWEHRCPDCRLQ